MSKLHLFWCKRIKAAQRFVWFVQENGERRWDGEMQVVYNQGQDLLIALPTQLSLLNLFLIFIFIPLQNLKNTAGISSRTRYRHDGEVEFD